jgi:predicted amidohydrolase
MSTLKAAAIQMCCRNGDVEVNLQKAGTLAAEAACSGTRLIVLPELFNTVMGIRLLITH